MSVVVENGLRQDGSAFTPGPPVWAGDNFAALRSHFIEQPDLGKTSYLKNLEGQMAGPTTGRSSSWRSSTTSTWSSLRRYR